MDENKALVIVDVQKGFVNEHTEHILPLVEKLQYSTEYKLVIASKYINSPNSPFRRWMEWNEFSADSIQDVPLAFKKGEHVKVIEKNYYTSVTPEFLAELERSSVNEVHICGIATDCCVLKTAVDLFEDGRFKPIVLGCYCASHYHKDMHSKGLDVIGGLIGEHNIIMH